MALNKKRTALFLLILLFSLVILWLYLSNVRGFFKDGEVNVLIKKADSGEKRALIIVDRLLKTMEFDVVEDPDGAKRKYLEADLETDQARKELDRVISQMDELRELKVPIWEKNYADLRIQSVGTLIKALDGFDQWFSKMELVADFLKRTTAAQQKFSQGLEKINESIEDSNSRDYERAKAKASRGKQLFDESQELLQEAGKMDKSAHLDPVLLTVSKALDFASLTIQLAEAGASGRTDEYNEIAQKAEDSKAEVLKDWKPEAIKNPKRWYSKKIRGLESSITNYLAEAAEMRERATVLYKRSIR